MASPVLATGNWTVATKRFSLAGDPQGGVAFLGDLDGDGLHSEVAIGESGRYSGSGCVYICWFDPVAGSIVKLTELSNGKNGVAAVALAAGGTFGTSIALLGDLDGDGVAFELAVGAAGSDSRRGAVWLVWLRPSDGHATKMVQLTSGVAGIPTLQQHDFFGVSVVALNSPSWLLVGADGDDDGGSPWAGAAYTISLTAGGAVTAVKKLTDSQNGFPSTLGTEDHFGVSTSCLGDLAGSGQGVHVAIGASGRSYNGDSAAGAVFVMRLRTSDGRASDVVEIGDGRGGLPQGSVQSGSYFGTASAFLGKLDDSGWPVLLVGVSIDDTGGPSRAGAAYLLWLGISDATSPVKQHVKLGNGLSGMPADLLGSNAYFGYFFDALGLIDGSEGCSGVIDRRSRTLVKLRRPARPAIQLTATTASPSTGLSMAGGDEVLVEGIAPPLTTAADDWLSATQRFVIDGVALNRSELGNATSAVFQAPSSSRPLLAVNFTVDTPERSLIVPVKLGYPIGVETASAWVTDALPASRLRSNERLGAALANIGDADGDGCSRDMAIGLPGHETPASNQTVASNHSAEASTPSQEPRDSGGLLLRGQSCTNASASLTGLNVLIDGRHLQSADTLPAGAQLGSSVAWLGSASPRAGQRRTYLAAGTPGAEGGSGSVLLLRLDHDDGGGDGGGDGGEEWSVQLLSRLSMSNATWQATELAGSRLGAALALANVVGESTATLLIGAPAARNGRGGVLVADVAMSAGQLLSEPVWIGTGTAGVINATLGTGDAFGSAVAWTHIDGIGASDSLQLMVGAPGDDSAGTDSGCVYLLTLHADNRTVATWQRLFHAKLPVGSGDRFGASLAWLGDVDGDNVFEEVLIGAPGRAAALVVWVQAENGGATSMDSGWLLGGWPGYPSSLPEGSGSAVAPVGDWNGDRVAGDVLLGAPLDNGGDGSVVHIRFATVAKGPAPWGSDVQLTVSSVSPHSALPFDQPTLIRINGTALYEWDPWVENSRLAYPPEVLISGLDPRGCEVEEVSFDGQAFTCWLSPSLEPNRTLRVRAGQAVSSTGLEVSYDIQGSVEAVDDMTPLRTCGGEARTFTGFGLLGNDSFSAAELETAGVGHLMIGDKYECPLSNITQSPDGTAVVCRSMPAGAGGPYQVHLQLPGAVVSSSSVTLSYEASAITSVDVVERLGQAGGMAVTFGGSGLLASGGSPPQLDANGVKLLIGDTYHCPLSNLARSADGKSITCNSMPAGVGGPHPVRLQLPGGIESNSSVAVSYEAAVVSSIEPSMVQLTSVTLLNFTISGSSFGHSLADTPRVVIGGNDCLDIEWRSSTELFCAAVAGNFTDHDVVVFTQGPATPMHPSTGGNARLDYLESPQVVAALPPEVGTRGGDNITCMGLSFANQGPVIDQVLVGGAPCLHWAMVDSYSLTCTTPPGTGRDHYITIVTKFGITIPSVTQVLSYAAPTLASSEPAVAYADETLAYDFDITGTGFGVNTSSSTVDWVKVAGKVCPTVDHVSDSMVRCVGIHPPWDGEQVVQVSVAGQLSEAKALIEFQDPPSVTYVQPAELPTVGGGITVRGSGFGGSINDVKAVWVGGYNCTGLHAHSSTAVSCTVPAGSGNTLAISIEVAKNGASEPQPLFSFAPPSVGGLTALWSGGQLEDYTFVGLQAVALVVEVANAGVNLADLSLVLSSGDTWSQGCPLLVRAGGAANETDGIDQLRQLECIGLSLETFPVAGGTMRATLEVGGQASAESPSGINVVGQPAVSLVTPGTGISTHGAGNTSHAPVQVLGTNFGRKPSDVLGVSVGGVECPLVEWKQPDGESPQLLVAIPPGVGAAVALNVTTRGGLSDASRSVAYQPAEVASIEPTYALTGTGTTAFNVTGQHFGNRPADLDRIQVGEQECLSIEWVSSTRVVCHAVSRSRWESRSVTVTVGGQEGLKNSYFEAVGDPVIDVVSPAVAGIGEEVLILGKAFGQQASDIVNVTVLGEPCSNVVHRGSTALSCTLPQPPADVRQVAVTNPRLLRDVPLVVWNAAGKQSAAANVSYSGSGNPLTEAPSHLLAWRPVGQPRQFTVRWAFPADEQMEGVDDVESFTIELSQLLGNDTQQLSIRVSSLDDVVTTHEGMRVFRHDDFVFTDATVSIRIRAANPTGDGPWSEATPPVPATCTDGTFLQTQGNASRWQCGVCPVGAFCGGANAANVTALPGFWRVPWSRSGLGFSKCPREDSCLGYEAPTAFDRVPLANGSASSSLARLLTPFLRPAGADALSQSTGMVPTRWHQAAMASKDATWRRRMARTLLSGNPNGYSVTAHGSTGSRSHALPDDWPPSPPRRGRQLEAVASQSEQDSPLLNETLAADGVPTAVDLRLWGDPAAMESCEEGYHGTMCTSCEPGHTRWGSYGCRKCKPAAVVALAMVGLAVLVFVVITYLIVSAIRSGAEKTPVGTAAIKVAFSHIQTVAIAASFNLEWPDSVLSLFAGMSTATSVSSEVLSLDCALPSDGNEASAGDGQSRFFAKAGIVLAMPLLMLAVAAGVWLTSACCERQAAQGVGGSSDVQPAGSAAGSSAAVTNPMRTSSRAGRLAADLSALGRPSPPSAAGDWRSMVTLVKHKLSFSHADIGVKLSAWDKLLTSAVVMLFLVHMSVTTTSLQLLTCRDIAPTQDPGAESSVLDGDLTPAAAAGLASATSGGCDADQTHRRLVQDLEVCCYDKEAQRRMFGLGIPGLLVYAFGIPITAALLLWWRRDSLHSHHTKTTLGFLYAGFKDEAYYWESVVMLRKVLVAVIAVSLEPMGVTLQTYTALVVIFALAVLHARVWPYSRSLLNRLELGALVAAFATFECGLFLSDPATSRSMRTTATMGIFLANIAFLMAALTVILWDKLGVRARRHRSLLETTSAPRQSLTGRVAGKTSQ